MVLIITFNNVNIFERDIPMEITILQIGDVAIKLSNLFMPIIMASLTYMITIWFKDFLSRIAKGWLFKMNDQFNEGDKVILDNEYAIIVKMGVTHTVFSIVKSNGDYTWRYVPNETVHTVKLEKIVKEKED